MDDDYNNATWMVLFLFQVMCGSVRRDIFSGQSYDQRAHHARISNICYLCKHLRFDVNYPSDDDGWYTGYTLCVYIRMCVFMLREFYLHRSSFLGCAKNVYPKHVDDIHFSARLLFNYVDEQESGPRQLDEIM